MLTIIFVMNYDCNECGNAASDADAVVVGTLKGEVLFVCNECRAETLVAETTLSAELAAVAAVQQLTDYTDDQIAALLDIDSDTVADRRARIESEIAAAAETLDRLDGAIGLETVDPEEFENFHDQIGVFRSTVAMLADLAREQ